MNWLAHIFLSEQNINFQIGNYLADPLKGKYWEDINLDLKKGMIVHKIIDSYTDAHEEFKKSKNRLGEKGLLKSVVIDLTYDYLLTKNWNTFCKIPIDEFLQTFYNQANNQFSILPNHAVIPLKRMVDFNLLNKYKTFEDLNMAFVRVDKRLSPKLRQRDQVSSYFEKVVKNINEIEKDFLVFFPQLCLEVRKNVNQEKLGHWKK